MLLIDADPQGSLSQGFFGSQLIECLEPQETPAALFDVRSLFAMAATLPVPTQFEGITLVRANQAIDQARRLNPKLRRSGHLVTRYDGRLLVHRSYEQRLQVLYRESVLETVIPEASAFEGRAGLPPAGRFSQPQHAGRPFDNPAVP